MKAHGDVDTSVWSVGIFWNPDCRYPLLPSRPRCVVAWLSYSPLDPRFTGLNPAGVDGFFSERKSPENDFLWKGSKAPGPVS